MKEFLSKMVKVKDIKKAIIDKIKTLNIKVYSDNIKEGFDTPCIFVSVEKYENSLDNSNTIKKYLDIYVRYIDKDEINRLDVLDNINLLFVKTLEVKDRIFTLHNKINLFKDEYVELNFDIEFYEGILEPESEFIENFELNI